jgi:integrase
MGCVYARKNSLWIKFKDEKGDWCYKPSGFKLGDERKAKGLLERLENLVAAGKQVGSQGPLTVNGWSEIWLETRRDKGVVTIQHYITRLKLYILPVIGHLRLDEVRVHHIQEIVSRAKKAKLAPRTVRHVYFTAHTMFEKAARRDLLLGNPCKIDEDDLPGKIDKNPEWRAGAIFSREELELVISDPRLPEWRQMFWALLFLTGMRFGEGSARRWRHWQPAAKPLGRLVINTSYNSLLCIEKEPKTKHARDVPVHPVLDAMLTEWRLLGWARAMGREPTQDDLIVPFAEPGRHFGKNLDDQMTLRRFHEDLDTLGLRHRRQHDTRRTFISLCMSDGARKEILKWVTHSRPKEDQIDDYTTLLWSPLCEEVAKLQVQRRRDEPGKKGADTGGAAEKGDAGALRVTPQVTSPSAPSEMSCDPASLRDPKKCEEGDSNPHFLRNQILRPTTV